MLHRKSKLNILVAQLICLVLFENTTFLQLAISLFTILTVKKLNLKNKSVYLHQLNLTPHFCDKIEYSAKYES